MGSVQVKNFPDDVHEVLRRRAAEVGQSLQEYLLQQLTEQARHPTVDEVLERMAGGRGGAVSLGGAARDVRAERECR